MSSVTPRKRGRDDLVNNRRQFEQEQLLLQVSHDAEGGSTSNAALIPTGCQLLFWLMGFECAVESGATCLRDGLNKVSLPPPRCGNIPKLRAIQYSAPRNVLVCLRAVVSHLVSVSWSPTVAALSTKGLPPELSPQASFQHLTETSR